MSQMTESVSLRTLPEFKKDRRQKAGGIPLGPMEASEAAGSVPDVAMARQDSGHFHEGTDDLLRALERGDAAAVGTQLDRYPHLATARLGPVRITPLQMAASLRDGAQALAVVQEVLRRCPAASGEDRLGRGALYHAASRGHADVVRLLLGRGADPAAPAGMRESRQDLLDGFTSLENWGKKLNEGLCDVECLGRTPLHQAAKAGHADVVALLLGAGAEPDAEDVAGVTPLLLAGAGVSPKKRGAVARYEQVVENLVKGGANVNKRNPATGMTALHHATLLCSWRATTALLDKGAEVSAGECSGGETALHTAASAGCERVVRLLLAKGGAALVNAPDQVGCTPLHKAAYSGSRLCLSLLLQHRGNLAALTASGFTVVDLVFSYVPRPLNFFLQALNSGVGSNTASVNDRDFRIRVDFSVLTPEAAELQMDVTSAIMSGSSDIQQMKLFQHPLLELFVRFKWRRLRYFFCVVVALQMCLVASVSWFVIVRRKTYADRLAENDTERWLRRVALVSSVMLLGHGMMQLLMYPRHYLRESEMWLNLGCSSLVLVVAMAGEVDSHVDMDSTKHQLVVHTAALAVLAAWADLMMLVSRFSIWGYYALMFNAVLLNVVKVLFVFMFLIIGFSLSFSILFYRSPHFVNPLTSLVKTTVMMMGEYEYMDMFQDPIEEQEWCRLVVTSRIVFLIFILLASIVLMNLMVGLAVSDIQELQTVGHVRRLLKQAEFVVHLEKLTQRFGMVRERLRMSGFLRISPTFTAQPVLGGRPVLSTRLLEALVALALRNRRRANARAAYRSRGESLAQFKWKSYSEESDSEVTDADDASMVLGEGGACSVGGGVPGVPPPCAGGGDGVGAALAPALAELLGSVRCELAELRARLDGESPASLADVASPLLQDARRHRPVRRASTAPTLTLSRSSAPAGQLRPPTQFLDDHEAQGIVRRLQRSARITRHPTTLYKV